MPILHARRRPGLLVAVAALAVAVGACGIEDGSQLSEAELGRATTTTTEAPPTMTALPDDPDGLPRYEEVDCPAGTPQRVAISCGVLTVPRDRTHPDEGTIDIAVARLSARGDDPKPDPVLYLEGGPGGASLVYLDWWADHELLEDRDIILFDQRGTGYSDPNLACDEEFDTAIGNEVDVAVYEDCYLRLAAETDLADFTTMEAAADVAGLIGVLRDEDPTLEVNLLGVSYGTRLAMVVQTLYPEGIRSVVLDSVYPPAVEAFEQLAPNGAGAFDELWTACAEDPDCDTAYGDLEATFYETIERLDDKPVPIELTDDWSGEDYETEAVGTDLVDGVFGSLYDATLIPSIPGAIDRASSGQPADVEAALRTLAGEDVYETGAASFGEEPPDDSDGLYYSVTCSEEMPITRLADVRTEAASIDEEVRDELVETAEYDISVCKVWDAGQSEAEPLGPVDSDLPTLLLGGRFDPITPPRWAFESAERLPNGYAFEFDGIGHGVMDSDPCPMSVVQAFLDDPTTEPDASCASEMDGIEFDVD